MTDTIKTRIEKILEEISGVRSQSGVSDWEYQRLLEWKDKTQLSPKQEDILLGIEEKVWA